MSRPDVVVIGGGLAGIAAALHAAENGSSVTLVERRGKLGGLTWSFERRGRWFDNGQHVFLRCCTAYRAFLKRIGAEHMVSLQRRLRVPVLAPGAKGAVIARSAVPAPLHLAGSLARYGHLSVTERLGLIRPALALRRLDLADPALDQISFGRWLAEHGQGPHAIEALWNLIALPTLNVRADEASLALAAMVFRTGLLDRADSGDIGWATVPLGELHAEAAGRALRQAGVEVILGTSAHRVEPLAHGSVTVVLDQASIEAGSVIVATPPEVASSLLGPDVLGPIEALGSSPILNVHLVFDRPVSELAMFACVSSPVQFVFDRTDSCHFGRGNEPSGDEQCLSISLSAADADIGRRPEALISSYRDALGQILPAVRRAELLDAVVTRERAATFRAVPGSAQLRPSATTSREGVFVAGAWCDTGWPATMEGAVRAGNAAAVAALDRLGASNAETSRQKVLS